MNIKTTETLPAGIRIKAMSFLPTYEIMTWAALTGDRGRCFKWQSSLFFFPPCYAAYWRGLALESSTYIHSFYILCILPTVYKHYRGFFAFSVCVYSCISGKIHRNSKKTTSISEASSHGSCSPVMSGTGTKIEYFEVLNLEVIVLLRLQSQDHFTTFFLSELLF